MLRTDNSMTQVLEGYVELASPQLLENQWKELNFDLALSHNVLQDLVVPESGGGYVYKDAKSVGSPTQNRFIYWRTVNDILELVEMSTEVVLDDNQVRIKFANSPIINNVNVIEFSDSIIIVVATLNSVHKLDLPHPKTTNKSILADLNNVILFNPSNYHVLSNQGSINSQQPICAASWTDKNMVKCAISFPDSSISIIQFGIVHHHISITEIKQIGIIGRLWSRMPSLLNKTQNDCDNAIYFCLPYYQLQTRDVLLFTLCRDWRIRIFSTTTKECLASHSMIPQASFSQSIVSHNNPTTEQPIMKLIDSQIIIYLTENRPEFVFLDYSYKDGQHLLEEKFTCQAPGWEKLIDFTVTNQNIWALSHSGDNQTTLAYLDRSLIEDHDDDGNGPLEGTWDYVWMTDDFDTPSIKNFVAEIFWRNHFSLNTIQKALVGVVGTSLPKKSDFESLEQLAYTSIVESNQDEAWTRFYNYCLQNHITANKNIGLFAGLDESVIGLVKRSNPSFICPWLTTFDSSFHNLPYRGIDYYPNYETIMDSLNYINTEFIDEEHSYMLEQRIFEDPTDIMQSLRQVVSLQLTTKKIDMAKLSVQKNLLNIVSSSIESLCDQLDLTKEAQDYGLKILEGSTRFKSDHNPLESNSGITITFELFKRLVQARMDLCRDILIYFHLKELSCESDKSSDKSLMEFYTSGKFKRLLDSYRSYALLLWISETPIKSFTSAAKTEVIDHISKHFKFFKKSNVNSERNQNSILEQNIRQNLFMSFLINGGVNYCDPQTTNGNTLSNTLYVTNVALNICKLLWAKSNHICFAEYLFTHQLDEHLSKYLDLTEDWIENNQYDKHFIRAANCLVQNRANQSVEIFDKLWSHITCDNLLGRFIHLETTPLHEETQTIPPSVIHKYYDALIQLFQIQEDYQSLVILINQCMSLLDENADREQQQWINCLRAKIFQYYLELDEPNEAYHTMVLTTDSSLRTNCLRKFIVHHCEKQQWLNLLSYPYIDIMHDFIDILTQKAENSDLSKLNEKEFYKTSFYDLLFASYASENKFRQAAEVMYSYAQRLAHEVPGMISIRKQADCLLITLNALKCVEPQDAYVQLSQSILKEDSRGVVLKRSYDSEPENPIAYNSEHCDNHNGDGSVVTNPTKIYYKHIEINYELTRSRLKLLEKDPIGNAIALSPLKAEETINQLVKSSMFSAAMDLAVLMKAPMEPILEGLTNKYIFLMGTTINVDSNPELEGGLSDMFTHSYSNINTYNYVANSTSPIVDKIWRLIDYYLVSYDGISHRYSTDAFKETFSGSTVLMKVVAIRILAAGYDVPASLRRLYMARNSSELLRLLLKYDKLVDAADLVIEMVDRLLEPANAYPLPSPFCTSEPHPMYLPTHLILLLVSFLDEDATNTTFIKIGNEVMSKLNKYRQFLKSN